MDLVICFTMLHRVHEHLQMVILRAFACRVMRCSMRNVKQAQMCKLEVDIIYGANIKIEIKVGNFLI